MSSISLRQTVVAEAIQVMESANKAQRDAKSGWWPCMRRLTQELSSVDADRQKPAKAPIVLGIFIPLLALMCSRAGSLGATPFYGIAVVVMVLSVSHLRDAISLLTGCNQRDAILLGLAVDAAIVMAEVYHTQLGLLLWPIAISCTLISMTLNVIAFQSHSK